MHVYYIIQGNLHLIMKIYLILSDDIRLPNTSFQMFPSNSGMSWLEIFGEVGSSEFWPFFSGSSPGSFPNPWAQAMTEKHGKAMFSLSKWSLNVRKTPHRTVSLHMMHKGNTHQNPKKPWRIKVSCRTFLQDILQETKDLFIKCTIFLCNCPFNLPIDVSFTYQETRGFV